MAKLSQKYADAQPDTLDGVTVQYPDWWFHVGKSNTDPLLRLHLEACTASLLEQKLAELTPCWVSPKHDPRGSAGAPLEVDAEAIGR